MGTHLLTSADDLLWLRDVHLATCAKLPPFVAALIHGNEDAPEAITLYATDTHDAPTLTLTPDESGRFSCDRDTFPEVI